MHVAYWIVASLLALFYAYAGGKKLLQSKEQLQPMMGWVDRVPMPQVRLIGGLEVLGALGLLLPPLTGIAVGLAVAAAVGLALVQIGGTVLHLSRGEARVIGLNIALLVAAVAAAWLGAGWL
ncbi:DoxX family protein [Streptomyces corynorhini]|uniref:DoxX family protein n=1 Tax=Streptomyces corynorhini TaxID=2282652 RepID=A0A370B192_9ACTN|nr:DoxX family protein [Streptomyces corynorhini]RDG35618.1 DoxX family protein [Streptomyces corynorhini]